MVGILFDTGSTVKQIQNYSNKTYQDIDHPFPYSEKNNYI